MKRRDLIKRLEKGGFEFKEHGANHDTYKRGNDTEQVPRHNEINEITAKKNPQEVGALKAPRIGFK